MRLFIPLIMTAIFACYALYMLFIKREFKAKFRTDILPGMFFIGVWVVCYWVFLS